MEIQMRKRDGTNIFCKMGDVLIPTDIPGLTQTQEILSSKAYKNCCETYSCSEERTGSVNVH